VTEVAAKTGLSRESLYRALSARGNPSLATILNVARALDLRLRAEAA
jgi:probable addiction module antidote protein